MVAGRAVSGGTVSNRGCAVLTVVGSQDILENFLHIRKFNFLALSLIEDPFRSIRQQSGIDQFNLLRCSCSMSICRPETFQKLPPFLAFSRLSAFVGKKAIFQITSDGLCVRASTNRRASEISTVIFITLIV